MAGEPLVSAVLSTWNRAALVEQAVRSVLAQSVPPATPVEVIVVDDGSTDGTAERLAREFGDRVAVHRQPNGGAASARNAGVRLARGRYVAFLDSDDEWTPDHLEAELEAFRAEPGLGLVYGEYHSYEGDRLAGVFPRRAAPSGMAFDALLSASLVQTSTAMVPREVALETLPFNESYKLGDEYDFFLRIARRRPIRFLPRPLVRYRVHGGNTSKDGLTFNREMLAVYRGLDGDARLAPRSRAILSRRIARYHLNVARLLEAAGSGAEAHAHYREAMRAGPWIWVPKGIPGWMRTRSALRPPVPASPPPSSFAAPADAPRETRPNAHK
ncbi:MAG: glycosyltransferase [Planctomycetales bacterium]|nr:glycosyltransferase [Planctomycetales bacterium]